MCDSLSIPYTCLKTDIKEVVFDIRKEDNPCSLCAKMRRGAINSAITEKGIRKLALGHHFDDVVETFMLNLFHEGRIGTFSPVTYLSRTGLTVIRPLVYMPEKDIRYFASKAGLPTLGRLCPADGNTEREEMKKLLAELDRQHRGLKYRIFGAIRRGKVDGFSDVSRMAGTSAYSED
jgi:tRNA(Ile)-lysidine synthase TilS/MesJ